jgi:hypothetical protein
MWKWTIAALMLATGCAGGELPDLETGDADGTQTDATETRYEGEGGVPACEARCTDEGCRFVASLPEPVVLQGQVSIGGQPPAMPVNVDLVSQTRTAAIHYLESPRAAADGQFQANLDPDVYQMRGSFSVPSPTGGHVVTNEPLGTLEVSGNASPVLELTEGWFSVGGRVTVDGRAIAAVVQDQVAATLILVSREDGHTHQVRLEQTEDFELSIHAGRFDVYLSVASSDAQVITHLPGLIAENVLLAPGSRLDLDIDSVGVGGPVRYGSGGHTYDAQLQLVGPQGGAGLSIPAGTRSFATRVLPGIYDVKLVHDRREYGGSVRASGPWGLTVGDDVDMRWDASLFLDIETAVVSGKADFRGMEIPSFPTTGGAKAWALWFYDLDADAYLAAVDFDPSQPGFAAEVPHGRYRVEVVTAPLDSTARAATEGPAIGSSWLQVDELVVNTNTTLDLFDNLATLSGIVTLDGKPIDTQLPANHSEKAWSLTLRRKGAGPVWEAKHLPAEHTVGDAAEYSFNVPAGTYDVLLDYRRMDVGATSSLLIASDVVIDGETTLDISAETMEVEVELDRADPSTEAGTTQLSLEASNGSATINVAQALTSVRVLRAEWAAKELARHGVEDEEGELPEERTSWALVGCD